MIVFVLRRYNDVDHVVPVIDRLVRDEGPDAVRVFSANPLMDVDADFRLAHLKKLGVNVGYLYAVGRRGLMHRFSAWWGRRLLIGHTEKRGRLREALLQMLMNRSKWFSIRWAESVLEECNAATLVYDWHRPRTRATMQLLRAARRKGVRSCSLPHGITLFSNELVNVKAVRRGSDQDYARDWKYYDTSVVNSKAMFDRVTGAGLSAGRVRVIGSARYCSEWRRKYESLCPPEHVESDPTRKLRLVFMDHAAAYRHDVERTLESIRRIQTLGFVDLIVKPSTAGLLSPKIGRKSMTSHEIYHLARVEEQLSSYRLIEWADAILCATSSICVEALQQNKVFLYPSYFVENTMIFDELNACWRLNDEDELLEALRRLSEDPGYRPYRDADVERFIVETIYGGRADRDVLGEFLDVIRGEEQTTAGSNVRYTEISE